jgi:hypothetical protein
LKRVVPLDWIEQSTFELSIGGNGEQYGGGCKAQHTQFVILGMPRSGVPHSPPNLY